MTPERNETYDRITAIIQRETLPCEPILIFPQTPIFYLLADRPMMGHAVVHWFDFLPDNLARKEMGYSRIFVGLRGKAPGARFASGLTASEG